MIIGFLTSLSYAQCGISYDYDHKNFTDLEKRNLTGRIANVKYLHFDVINKFGKISKGVKNCEQEIFFNKNGTVEKIIKYNPNGEIENVDIHEYENDDIKLISHYNNSGLLIAKTAYVTEGNTIRKQRYLGDGELNQQYFVMTYDINGNMVKELWKYHDDKNDINEYQNSFDENNRLIQIKTDSKITRLSYDSNNFSKSPNKIETIDIETNKVRRSRSYEFDLNGNTIKKFFNHKLSRSYKYDYDKLGNWINKIEYTTEAKIPEMITERTINYFE